MRTAGLVVRGRAGGNESSRVESNDLLSPFQVTLRGSLEEERERKREKENELNYERMNELKMNVIMNE